MAAASQTARSQSEPPAQSRAFGARQLSGDLQGTADHRPPLVLLHGLTFDRRMWRPAIAAMRQCDPGRVVLALDLPGHGGSPMQDIRDLDDVGAAVASAVEDAGLDAPVVVGHSISGIIATFYAVGHRTRGVVNVDVTLDTAFIRMLKANHDALVGPGFAGVWRGLLASMHMEVLPDSARALLNTDLPRQDVFLAYQRQALETPEDQVQEWIARTLDALRQSRLPYAVIAGHDYDDAYTSWLHDMLPQATITVFPDGGHFPHLADPERFAAILAKTGQWGGGR